MTTLKINIPLLNIEVDIKYPNVTYSYFKSLKEFRNDDDLIEILYSIEASLDCTMLFNNMQVVKTNTLVYDDALSTYYYYILHLDNQLLYNQYIDKLADIILKNTMFELSLPKYESVPKVTKTVKKASTRKSTKKVYVKQITKDMFTGKETYLYVGGDDDIIQSNDPDLIDENGHLKKKPKVKKEKKPKSSGVPLSSMMFDFNNMLKKK